MWALSTCSFKWVITRLGSLKNSWQFLSLNRKLDQNTTRPLLQLRSCSQVFSNFALRLFWSSVADHPCQLRFAFFPLPCHYGFFHLLSSNLRKLRSGKLSRVTQQRCPRNSLRTFEVNYDVQPYSCNLQKHPGEHFSTGNFFNMCRRSTSMIDGCSQRYLSVSWLTSMRHSWLSMFEHICPWGIHDHG